MTFCLDFDTDNSNTNVDEINSDIEDVVNVSIKCCFSKDPIEIEIKHDSIKSVSDMTINPEDIPVDVWDLSPMDLTVGRNSAPWIVEQPKSYPINSLLSVSSALDLISGELQVDPRTVSFVKVDPKSGQPTRLEYPDDMLFISRWNPGEEIFVDMDASKEEKNSFLLFHYLESLHHAVHILVYYRNNLDQDTLEPSRDELQQLFRIRINQLQ